MLGTLLSVQNYTDLPSTLIARVRLSLDVVCSSHPFTLETFKREGQDLKAEWKTQTGRRYVIPDVFIVLASITHILFGNAYVLRLTRV